MRWLLASLCVVGLGGCFDFASLTVGDDAPADGGLAADATATAADRGTPPADGVASVDLTSPPQSDQMVTLDDAWVVTLDATSPDLPPDLTIVQCISPAGNGVCAPTVPASWSGPFAVYEGGATMLPPPCGAGYDATPSYTGNYGISAGGATCSCSCNPPSGVTCSSVTVTFFATGSCPQGAPCATASVSTSGCTSISLANCPTTGVSSIAGDTLAQGGSCAPGVTVKSTLLPTWSQHVQACTPTLLPEQGSCDIGDLCAPFVDAGYHVCIAQNVDLPCPASSAYVVKRLAYSTYSDTRACTACACGAVVGAKCSGYLNLSHTCTGVVTSKPVPYGCGLAPIDTQAATLQAAAQGGSCPGSTSPTGGVKAIDPTTFCCLD